MTKDKSNVNKIIMTRTLQSVVNMKRRTQYAQWTVGESEINTTRLSSVCLSSLGFLPLRTSSRCYPISKSSNNRWKKLLWFFSTTTWGSARLNLETHLLTSAAGTGPQFSRWETKEQGHFSNRVSEGENIIKSVQTRMILNKAEL